MRARLRHVAAFLLGAGLLVSACGGSASAPAASTQTQSAGTTQTAAATTNTTLVVAEQSEPPNLQPDAKINDAAYAEAQNLFNKLVTLDYHYSVIPDLATSWDISSDGLTYTFHLAQGVNWSDGQPFTSADVVWTLNEILSQKGVAATSLSSISKVEAPDANTVVLTLSHPDAALLGFLGWYGTFILPRHVYQGSDWLTNPANEKPVGTGPFTFSDWQKGDHMTLVANPKYFKGAPKVGKLVFRFIPDSNTALQAFLNGEVDIDLATVPPQQIATLKSNPKVAVVQIPSPSRYYIAFNFREAPTSNLAFRQAVAYAVDRQDMLTRALAGIGQAATGMYTPVYQWAFNSDASLPAYNLTKAGQLLDSAGMKAGANGQRGSVEMLYFSLTPYSDMATIIRDDLAKVGVNVKLDALDISAYTARVGANPPNFQMTLLDGFQGPDPAQLRDRIGKGGAENFMGYDNPQIDSLLAKADELTGNDQRGPVYKQVEAVALQDLPIVPLDEVVSNFVDAAYVHGTPWQEGLGKVTFSDFSLATIAPH